MSNSFKKSNNAVEVEPSSENTSELDDVFIMSLSQEKAFTGFYKHYFAKLVNNLRSIYGLGPPDPSDVAQQAFEKLRVQQHIRDPEGYVWVCARNIIMSEKRAERVRDKNQAEVEQRFFGASCDTFEPERVLIAREQLAIVMETLKSMSERRRRIFILNRLHGLTPKEAGQRSGVSRSSAVRHIALATEQIATVLSAEIQCSNEKGELSS